MKPGPGIYLPAKAPPCSIIPAKIQGSPAGLSQFRRIQLGYLGTRVQGIDMGDMPVVWLRLPKLLFPFQELSL
jgi:hypothetical protein